MCLTRLPTQVAGAAQTPPKALPTLAAWTASAPPLRSFATPPPALVAIKSTESTLSTTTATAPQLQQPENVSAVLLAQLKEQAAANARLQQQQQQQMLLQLLSQTQKVQPLVPISSDATVSAVLQRLYSSSNNNGQQPPPPRPPVAYMQPQHQQLQFQHQQQQQVQQAVQKQSEMVAPSRAAPAYVPITSKFRGVSWHRRDKVWLARAWLDGKIRHLGCFKSEEMAALAVDLRHIASFGEHGRVLNFADRALRQHMLERFAASGDMKLRRAAAAAAARIEEDDAKASHSKSSSVVVDTDASDAGSDGGMEQQEKAEAAAVANGRKRVRDGEDGELEPEVEAVEAKAKRPSVAA